MKPQQHNTFRETERNAPGRPEWDFSECPQQELVPCYLYEFARSSAPFLAGLKRFIDEEDPERNGRVGLGIWGDIYDLRTSCRHFPVVPWLSLTPDQKGTVFRRISLGDRAFRGEGYGVFRPGFESSWGGEQIGVEICWGAPITRIISDFTTWAKARHRERRQEMDPKAIWHLDQGRTPRWRDLLKCLGAWRLLRWGTADCVATYTQRIMGDPLYRDHDSFHRAKRTAEEHIKHFDRILPPTA